MSYSFGLVGLPNAGKSTIFNALTAAGAKVEAYPFSTIEPHRGTAGVPDPRLDALHRLFPDKKKVPATIEVVDIAGLVEGASHGEGLGNQFLAEIRAVDAIIHVVRCFPDPQVPHPTGDIDPRRDIEIVETELLLKDLETLERRKSRIEKVARTGDKAAREELSLLERLIEGIGRGIPIRRMELKPEELDLLSDLKPLTAKPVLYVANTGEEGENEHTRAVASIAREEGAGFVVIRGKLEAEIAEAADTEEERRAYLAEWGLEESALSRLVRAAYELLDLVTFYTIEGPEVRAWPVPRGTRAPDAGGKIHSDFKDRFVIAEVVNWQELVAAGSDKALREEGRWRRVGHDYVVQDGDVIRFVCA
ncbi:MAG TPA: redox-regulated ATPase YchF [Candidatus Acetothermia bacterium]|nr:redox-regulated ATPase YchF [Candidatus Acetothermia bacterium]